MVDVRVELDAMFLIYLPDYTECQYQTLAHASDNQYSHLQSKFNQMKTTEVRMNHKQLTNLLSQMMPTKF